MLRFRKKDSKELIKRMAKTNGCSVSEIRREMQYAIDEARNSDDPDKQAEFQSFFPSQAAIINGILPSFFWRTFPASKGFLLPTLGFALHSKSKNINIS